MRLQKFRVPGFCSRLPSISITPRSFLALTLSLACLPVGFDLPALGATPAAAKDKKPKQDPALKGLPITELSADEAILHALNRLAYGPRPGDIERVRQMGLAKWIEQQLNPNSIDDKAVEARLGDYPTLRMPTAKLIAEYPQPKQAEKQAERRAPAQERQEQLRRSAADTAVSTADQGMQSPQTPGENSEARNGGANGEPSSPSAGESPNAPAPMKQPETP